VRCRTIGLPCLQLESCIDLHGRLWVDVCRVLPRKRCARECVWRPLAKFLASACSPNSCSLHSDLRYDVRHSHSQAIRTSCVARRSRSHFSPSRCTWNVGTPRGLDAVWIRRLVRSVSSVGPTREVGCESCCDRRLHSLVDTGRRVSRGREGL